MLMTVKKAAPGCSGQPAVLDQLSGQFSSPDFGDGRQYSADLECSWLIVTAPDTVCQPQSQSMALLRRLMGSVNPVSQRCYRNSLILCLSAYKILMVYNLTKRESARKCA